MSACASGLVPTQMERHGEATDTMIAGLVSSLILSVYPRARCSWIVRMILSDWMIRLTILRLGVLVGNTPQATVTAAELR